MKMSNDRKVGDVEGIAFVLGFSIHGLAVARALSRAGVEVYALAQSGDLPTVRTRFAKVFVCEEIQNGDLTKILLDYRSRLPDDRPVVLFPTNDKMVRQLAENWQSLENAYLISWAHCRNLVLELQQKDRLAGYCTEFGVPYPHSFILDDRETFFTAENIAFPAIVKPVRPLSSFKAIVVENKEDILQLISRYSQDLPFLLQQYIPGSDETLWFCTMFLDGGREVCAISGRKLRSTPRGTGMGSVVETREEKQIITLARKFVNRLDFSGPIAMEFKRDSDGKFWFIEPNVGRTEYSVDLITRSGLNLPLIEYKIVMNQSVEISTLEMVPSIWFDTERDLFGYWWSVFRSGSLRPFGRVPVFPYFGQNDLGPLFSSTYGLLRHLAGSLKRKMVKFITVRD